MRLIFAFIIVTLCNAIEWDLNEALQLLNISFASYCPAKTVVSWSCPYCTVDLSVSLYSYDKFTDTIAFVGFNDNAVIVSFRGSYSMIDLEDDLMFEMTKVEYTGLSGIYVHTGFWESYENHRIDVLEEIRRFRAIKPQSRLILTGHSLGGAEATLLAMDLYFNMGIEDMDIYSFGSPRIGNREFADAFISVLGDRHRRVTHHRDLIVHLPPEIFGYKHVATEIHEDKYGKIRQCDGSGEDPICSDELDFYNPLDHTIYLGVSGKLC